MDLQLEGRRRWAGGGVCWSLSPAPPPRPQRSPRQETGRVHLLTRGRLGCPLTQSFSQMAFSVFLLQRVGWVLISSISNPRVDRFSPGFLSPRSLELGLPFLSSPRDKLGDEVGPSADLAAKGNDQPVCAVGGDGGHTRLPGTPEAFPREAVEPTLRTAGRLGPRGPV